MGVVQGLVLGTIQGITEWLPISSEGINSLILLHFFDKSLSEAVGISIWLHLGTVLAAILYFRNELGRLMGYFPKYARRDPSVGGSPEGSLISFLIIATLVSGMLGGPLLLLSLEQEDVPAEIVMAAIGVLLIATGLLQRYAGRFEGRRTEPARRDSVLLGIVQSFAAIPGLSRSGLTVSALLLRGFDKTQALRLSFLMSIPIVLAAEVGLAVTDGVEFGAAALAGVGAAFFFGLISIRVLLRISAKVAFWKFLVLLGAVSLLPLLIP